MNRRDTEDAENAQRFDKVQDGLNRLTERVIGASIEVHRCLGPGYLEAVYEEALACELTDQGIAFRRQHPFACVYKGHRVGEGRLDLFVADQLIVELKAMDSISAIHRAQVISYLRALNRPLGLLINFNVPLLKHGLHRIILSS
ncbi:GxxExxY protein [Thiohalocapsa marina]|uniref:GxxExxY protein n=1 Tax=Thiohalocapsa marina TaxID=424902 RepID=A0A5M8FT18_9GAMM|nr:GxxExxY protein [Thiohalocapsa marina]KAA6186732.1 GxxExxY protein [Thiohalocapsa marina]